MRRLLSPLALTALWWPATAAAHPRAHLSMVRAKAAITRFDGPTATTGRCWVVRPTVTACDFSKPYEGNWTFRYYAVARLRAGRLSVEWPGWEG